MATSFHSVPATAVSSVSLELRSPSLMTDEFATGGIGRAQALAMPAVHRVADEGPESSIQALKVTDGDGGDHRLRTSPSPSRPVSTARITIGWLVLFMWSFAYIMPIVPTAMCAVWIYEKRWRVTGPSIIGAVIVWAYYMIMDLDA
jgi:hypothetical protein